MIKAVFCDIGGVLADLGVGKVIAGLAEGSGKPVATVRGFLALDGLWEELERGKLTPRAAHARLRVKLGYRGDPRDFSRLVEDQVRVDRSVARAVLRLARKRRVFLVSNINSLQFAAFRRRCRLADRVCGAVLSFRVGARKPEPAMFSAALERARVRPREALLVDDLAENVAAARRLGMSAARFSPGRDLEAACS
jgi:putative hydrolase of the HAD superfamily